MKTLLDSNTSGCRTSLIDPHYCSRWIHFPQICFKCTNDRKGNPLQSLFHKCACGYEALDRHSDSTVVAYDVTFMCLLVAGNIQALESLALFWFSRTHIYESRMSHIHCFYFNQDFLLTILRTYQVTFWSWSHCTHWGYNVLQMTWSQHSFLI